jgi:hypothetical protein
MLFKKLEMEINRHNYEMYLLDYIEGKLSKDIALAVFDFLKNNPDIETEAKDLMETVLVSDTISFEHKETLKKNAQTDIPGISSFEQLSVAMLEGDITSDENYHLAEILKKEKDKNYIHKLIQKSKLVPDLSIVYPNKALLKHKKNTTKYIDYRYVLAMVASVAILLSFIVLIHQNKPVQFGSPVSNKNHSFKTRAIIKENSEKELINAYHIIQQTDYPEFDSTLIREKLTIQTIKSKQLAEIDVPLIKDQIPNLELLNHFNEINTNDEGYTSFAVYLKNKFKEKFLKQDKNERITFISIVNSFGRFTKKVFNKKIEIEKTITEDGKFLYAIKTDNFDLYTKTKAREKNKSKE